MNGGVDTLRLRLENIEIMPNANIQVQPASINMKTGLCNEHSLFVDTKGNLVTGEKAYSNPSWFQLDINYKGKFVKFSTPLVHSGGINNLLAPNSSNDLKATIERVECEMYDNGFKVNLFNGFLSRVDIFKMIESDYEYMNYASVYGNLLPNRKRLLDLGNDSFLYKNSQGQIIFYDKRAEIISKHNQPFNCPNNSHRHEIRFMNARATKSHLKVDTVPKLLELYSQLPVITANELRKVFKWQAEQFKTGLNEDLENDLRIYKDEYGQKSQSRYWTDYGLIAMIDQIGKEAVLKGIGAVHGKTAKSIARKRITQIEMESKLTDKMAVDLYAEIRSKAIDPNYKFSLVA